MNLRLIRILFVIFSVSSAAATIAILLLLVSPAEVKTLADLGILTITTNDSSKPTVQLGFIRSCTRQNDFARPDCASTSIPPRYDLSALSGVDTVALKYASTSVGGVVSIGLIFSFLFSVSVTAIAGELCCRTRPRHYKEGWVQNLTLSLGFLAVFLPASTLGTLYYMLWRNIYIFHHSRPGIFTADFGKSLWLMMLVYGFLLLTLCGTAGVFFRTKSKKTGSNVSIPLKPPATHSTTVYPDQKVGYGYSNPANWDPNPKNHGYGYGSMSQGVSQSTSPPPYSQVLKS